MTFQFSNPPRQYPLRKYVAGHQFFNRAEDLDFADLGRIEASQRVFAVVLHQQDSKYIDPEGNECDGGRMIAQFAAHPFGVEPDTEPRIVNFRMVVPERRLQITNDYQVVQMEFDPRNVFRKVLADVAFTHVQAEVFRSPGKRVLGKNYQCPPPWGPELEFMELSPAKIMYAEHIPVITRPSMENRK